MRTLAFVQANGKILKGWGSIFESRFNKLWTPELTGPEIPDQGFFFLVLFIVLLLQVAQNTAI